MYIKNVNSLQQELKFSHPKTLWKLNMIYNFHFTGCKLWVFSSKSFGKFMSTIQRSFKIMFDLPYETHRYFYEVVTATKHPTIIVKRRFVNFLSMINQSNKVAPKLLLQHVQCDVHYSCHCKHLNNFLSSIFRKFRKIQKNGKSKSLPL